MNKSNLDFIVIGAQKCGTTTLFHHLKAHPSIYVPPQKEVPYLHDPSIAQDWSDFLKTYFGDATPNQKIGSVTPQYMYESTSLPRRVKTRCPDADLIAILRNPIHRAESHYKMLRRRDQTSLDTSDFFAEALESVNQELPPDNKLHEVLARGKYAKILSRYMEEPPPRDVHVVFLENFKDTPAQVMGGIYEEIGVDPTFTPPNLGGTFHKGGTQRRIPIKEIANRIPGLHTVWSMLPRHVRSRIYTPIERKNVVPKDVTIPSGIREGLVDFYSDDVSLLEEIIDQDPPWSDWNGA